MVHDVYTWHVELAGNGVLNICTGINCSSLFERYSSYTSSRSYLPRYYNATKNPCIAAVFMLYKIFFAGEYLPLGRYIKCSEFTEVIQIQQQSYVYCYHQTYHPRRH